MVFSSLCVCLCLHTCVCVSASLWGSNCNTIPHCAATNWHRAHPHSSMAQLILAAAENHKRSSLPLLFFSLFSSKVQLTVPASLPPPSPLLCLSTLLPLTFLLTPPTFFYFLLKMWLELAGKRSGEFKLCICASLQVLPGPGMDREVRASGGGREGKDR